MFQIEYTNQVFFLLKSESASIWKTGLQICKMNGQCRQPSICLKVLLKPETNPVQQLVYAYQSQISQASSHFHQQFEQKELKISRHRQKLKVVDGLADDTELTAKILSELQLKYYQDLYKNCLKAAQLEEAQFLFNEDPARDTEDADTANPTNQNQASNKHWTNRKSCSNTSVKQSSFRNSSEHRSINFRCSKKAVHIQNVKKSLEKKVQESSGNLLRPGFGKSSSIQSLKKSPYWRGNVSGRFVLKNQVQTDGMQEINTCAGKLVMEHNFVSFDKENSQKRKLDSSKATLKANKMQVCREVSTSRLNSQGLSTQFKTPARESMCELDSAGKQQRQSKGPYHFDSFKKQLHGFKLQCEQITEESPNSDSNSHRRGIKVGRKSGKI